MLSEGQFFLQIHETYPVYSISSESSYKRIVLATGLFPSIIGNRPVAKTILAGRAPQRKWGLKKKKKITINDLNLLCNCNNSLTSCLHRIFSTDTRNRWENLFILTPVAGGRNEGAGAGGGDVWGAQVTGAGPRLLLPRAYPTRQAGAALVLPAGRTASYSI